MNIYVYKMVTDNGGAPCVSGGLLTLAICKPMIRKMAKLNSLVFGFGGKDYKDKLIYIAVVTGKLPKEEYYSEPEYAQRPDCIYEVTNGKPKIKSNARFHKGGDQLEHDVGFRFERAFVLLSTDFRYLGKKGNVDYQKRFQQVAELVNKMKRGHRVNHSPETFAQLLALKDQIWRSFPRNFNGKPTDSDFSKSCNDSSGSCRCDLLE